MNRNNKKDNKMQKIPHKIPQKQSVKRKGIGWVLFVLCICILSVMAGIFVPRYVLSYETRKQEGLVEAAPREYYADASEAMSRSASAQLSSLDRFKLATGEWESEYKLSSADKAFLTETEAVELAKSQLEIYYKCGLYPESVESNYRNWYSFTTQVYECIDTSFHTYAAYVWVIEFTKYDHSMVHQVYMTDSGTILLAQVNKASFMRGTVKGKFQTMDLKTVLGLSSDVYDLKADEKGSFSMDDIHLPGYENVEVDTVQGCGFTGNSKDGDIELTVLRFGGSDQYGIAIMP